MQSHTVKLNYRCFITVTGLQLKLSTQLTSIKSFQIEIISINTLTDNNKAIFLSTTLKVFMDKRITAVVITKFRQLK